MQQVYLGSEIKYRFLAFDDEGHSLRIDMDPEEQVVFEEKLSTIWQSRQNMVPAIFVPIRTHSLRWLAVDLFLPTTFNHSSCNPWIEGNAPQTAEPEEWDGWSVVLAIMALFIDLVTLPIRLVTCIPRVIWNALQDEHPLKAYLREQGADEALWKKESVKVGFGHDQYREGQKIHHHFSYEQFCFIDLPFQLGGAYGSLIHCKDGIYDIQCPHCEPIRGFEDLFGVRGEQVEDEDFAYLKEALQPYDDGSSLDQVFRKFARREHPDKCAQNEETQKRATEKFQKVLRLKELYQKKMI